MSTRYLHPRWLEYAGARLALRLLPTLSRPTLLRFARILASLSFTLSRRERRIGLENLRLAFPERTEAERRAILRQSFGNFSLAMLDTFWFSRDTAARIHEYTHFDEAGFAPIFAPEPQILITAHYGNWEVLGIAFAERGHPLTSVAAPLANRRVDTLFNEMRRMTGQRIVPKHGALRTLLRTLQGGGKIALLLDQNTKPSQGGVFVPFFGKPVPVSKAAAALWERTGVGVFVAMSLPRPDGHYTFPPVVRVDPPPADAPDRALEMTRRITATVESFIRAHPEHWLWMYKRWKYRPEGVPAAGYPAYSSR